MKNQDIENLIKRFEKSDIQRVDDVILYLRNIPLTSEKSDELKRWPLLVVTESDDDEFERRGNDLIKNGYKVISSSCGFLNSASENYSDYFMAIFVDKNLDK